MQQTSLAGWLTKKIEGDQPGSQAVTRYSDHSYSKVEVHQQRVSVESSALANGPDSFKRQNGAIPCNFTIEVCAKQHIAALRRLNSLMLPIPYKDNFYREILDDPITAGITRLAFWHDDPEAPTADGAKKLVAAIRCRLLSAVPNEPMILSPTLYISTIATLSPYRNHSIASTLLSTVMRQAVLEHGIESVTAHVWEANPEGLEWYQRRGFTVLRREENYYPRLAPQSAAWVIQRNILPSDVLQYSKS